MLTRLVDSTLDAARIEVGQIDTRSERCDLAALLRTVCDQQRAASPDAKISVRTDGDTIAICDPAHAEQVLKNLIANAVKYAAPGSEVSVILTGDDERLTCGIHSAGSVISDTDRARIFKRDFRGASSTGKPGTGAGLFIARTLAQMQGGDVALLPNGNVTAFRLSLPRPEGAAP